MAIIGLDAGSSGCKSVVFSDDGRQISCAYKEYETTGNVFEVDANEIWESACEVIAKSVANCREPVKGLAISSFGETFVAVDNNGTVLCNSILYSDPRGAEQCDSIITDAGLERLMETTGVKPHAMYSLPKLRWLRDNKTEVFSKAKYFPLMEDFIIYRLCGEKCIDYSLAARTMAFDIVNKKWDNSLLLLAGIDSSYMSKAVPPATTVGRVLPNIARELGLCKDTLIVTGGHDQVCAVVGAGITRSGMAADGMGTVECITPVFDNPVLKPEFLNQNYACVPYAVLGKYVTYAVNFTGGALLKWYRDNFAKFEAAQAKAQNVSVYALLDKQAQPYPTNIIVIPHFAGAGTPDMNPNAKGAIFGLSMDTSQSALYRAMLEGVTYEMKYNIECLSKLGINIHTLKATGGGARSPLWLQIKADITGCRVIPPSVQETGAAGAAMLAATACGLYASLEDAAKQFNKEKDPIEPLSENHAIYMEVYEKYKKLRNNI